MQCPSCGSQRFCQYTSLASAQVQRWCAKCGAESVETIAGPSPDMVGWNGVATGVPVELRATFPAQERYQPADLQLTPPKPLILGRFINVGEVKPCGKAPAWTPIGEVIQPPPKPSASAPAAPAAAPAAAGPKVHRHWLDVAADAAAARARSAAPVARSLSARWPK